MFASASKCCLTPNSTCIHSRAHQTGDRFVPGLILDTDQGPRFVPGKVIEVNGKVIFVPGQVVETDNGRCQSIVARPLYSHTIYLMNQLIDEILCIPDRSQICSHRFECQ